MHVSSLSLPVLFRRMGPFRLSAATACLLAIVFIALALRVFWVLYVDTYPLGGDPHWYFIVGINISKGFGFVAPRQNLYEIVGPGDPTAFWPPGYAFALAANFKLFGVSVTHAMVMNAVFGAATVPFVYGLGSAIFDRRTGLIAAALFAVFPNAIAWAPVLYSEQLFTLLFLAALWLAVASSRKRKWLPIVCFGVLTGMAALTRGEGLLLLPIAAMFWWLKSGVRNAAQSSAVALLAAAAIIAPWTIRNAFEMQAFIPISTNSATVLRIGHAPDSTGYTKWTIDEIDGVPMERAHFQYETEVKAYRAFQRRAVDYALGHPGREIELAGLKLYHLYHADVALIALLTTLYSTPFRPASLEHVLLDVFTVSYYALFFAAVLSVPLWLRRDPRRLLLASVFAFYSAFHVVFASDPRFHVPLYPAFAIAVAGGAVLAFDTARTTIGGRRSTPARSA